MTRPPSWLAAATLWLLALTPCLFAQDFADDLPPLPPVPDFDSFPTNNELPDLLRTPTVRPEPDTPPARLGVLEKDTGILPRPPKNLDLQGSNMKIDYQDGVVRWQIEGPVVLKGDNGLQAFSDYALVDTARQLAYLKGNVSVYQDGVLTRWDEATYDYKERKFQAQGLRTSVDPILFQADQFQTVQRGQKTIYIGRNAGVTTHDVQDPGFWVRAERTTVIPEDRVIFKNLKLYVGDTPVLWLPYLSQQLDSQLGYHVVPGGRRNLGVFLENRYGIMLGGKRDPVTGENPSAWLLAQFRADLYSRRGLGLGVEFFDTRVPSNADFGWLKLYYLYDLAPEVERSGISRQNEDPHRFRVDLAHRFPLFEHGVAQYDLEANLTYLSDRFFLEDFEEDIFRRDPQPDNTIFLTRRTANSLGTFGTRLRINDFYQTDTRFPELTFDWAKQPLGDTLFQYESQTSLGVYNELAGSLRDQERENLLLRLRDPGRAGSGIFTERGYWRAHTYHEISRNLMLGPLHIIPRVGLGFDHYGAIDQPVTSHSRLLAATGADISLRFNRRYPKWKSKTWGLDGARHVVQPYANFSFLAADPLPNGVGRIEALIPSTRPRPLRVGRFTAIDDLNNWGIVRLGVRNRLLTPRDGTSHHWLAVNTYLDLFLDDPEFDRRISNLYNDLVWEPLPWFRWRLETQFPIAGRSKFTELATSGTFMVNPDLEFDVSYRYLANHPILRDSSRLALEAFYRINDRWGVGAYNRWEFEDSTLELQQYSVHYDFDAAVASMGIFHRDNRREDEFGVLFNFGLKDFPTFALPLKVGAE